MENFSQFLRRWGPVLGWMLVMLVISTDLGSMKTSRRLMNPVFLWFDPTMTPQQLWIANVIFRKFCHLTEFAVLAVLVWRTRDLLKSPWPGTGTLQLAGMTLGVCAFFAIATELIQYAARSRAASVRDVLINLAGSVLGLGFIFLVKFLRRRPPPPAPKEIAA